MIQIDPDQIAERFMEYVKIDTQSDPNPAIMVTPTTEKQKDLSNLLADQLREIGLKQVEADQFGYVYATIPSNSTKEGIPAVCFCAHVDTAPDASGTGVKPIYHKNYDGSDIVLPDDPTQVLSPSKYPYLKEHIGHGVITASGLTLLGADDKAGVAVIMEATKFLVANPSLKHGDIKILFTPDEEVGGGMAKIDMNKVGAAFGYTLDSGDAGRLEDETFNADAALITIDGVSAHPGYAKGKMVNAQRVAAAFVSRLPMDEWCPEATSGRQGFVHINSTTGNLEQMKLGFIVRDFVLENLDKHHERLKNLADVTIAEFPGAKVTYERREQYRNMKQILDQNPHVMAYAGEAITRAGLEMKTYGIRGGTDGSQLSYKGMPCPNLFAGMQNYHGKLEWVGSKDMAKAAETVVHLAMVIEEKAPSLR